MQLGGGLIAAGANYAGQKDANVQNLRIAREQMQFQERMSGTSYQRAVEDMKLAGINPMLAFQQGGASSPSGQSATMQNALGPAVSSAMSALRLKKELELMEVEKQKKYQEGFKAMSEGAYTQTMNVIAGAGVIGPKGTVTPYGVLTNKQRLELLSAQTKLTSSQRAMLELDKPARGVMGKKESAYYRLIFGSGGAINKIF